ncbi:MAG: ATP-dependent RecD-like DNA helicase [Clostridiaceae bacterium]
MTSLDCKVDEIIYKNEENGYVVASVESTEGEYINIVGIIPFIIEGQKLKIQGDWVVHPNYGEQFKVEVCEEVLPSTKDGIEKYLASGVISGIGPVTAKKIVEKFGDETLDILENKIERLSEIDGIGDKKIDTIYESYVKQREVKTIMIFLQTYGVTPNQCVKIYKRFGKDAIDKVRSNPYVLVDEISGIGFKTSDKIARNLGIDINSPFRIKSGLEYTVNEYSRNGNTYIRFNDLIKEGQKLLSASSDDINRIIYDSVIEGRLKIDVIEGEECVYLPYYYNAETFSADKILYLALQNSKTLNIDIDKEIETFEFENDIILAKEQKEAVIGACNCGVEVITGGPGTGKTTIINCIVHIFEKANLKVYLSAPTGRAAKRMSQATNKEAKTIHRLLEMGFAENEDLDFLKDEDSPLDCDVIIVDEASMIDIGLFCSLLKAIKINTRLVIVGDVDQLPSVGPGNVLKDIIESNLVSVIRLKEIYRQARESMIIVNAHRINKGEMPYLNKKDKDFYFIELNDQSEILDTTIDLINNRLPKFDKNWNGIKDIQILSPMKKGTLGVVNLNKHLQNTLNPKSKYKEEKELKDRIFRVSDKVMQIKNNYTLAWERIGETGEKEGAGVFNGDVGYIDKIDKENEIVTVIFDDERRVEYENSYLDELVLAYAITIHKSQGSEFNVVIIPLFMGPPLLMNRNLLYTGITRAKDLVVLVGLRKSMKFMIDNNKSYERNSSLAFNMLKNIEK